MTKVNKLDSRLVKYQPKFEKSFPELITLFQILIYYLRVPHGLHDDGDVVPDGELVVELGRGSGLLDV